MVRIESISYKIAKADRKLIFTQKLLADVFFSRIDEDGYGLASLRNTRFT